MTIAAGQILTAKDFNAYIPISIVKPADESKTNTSISDDDTLIAWLEANSVYRVHVVLSIVAAAPATPSDIRIAYSSPTGSVGRRTTHGLAVGQTSTATANFVVSGETWDTESVYGCSTAATSITEDGILYTGPSAGMFKLRWCQRVANATATTIRAGSYMRLERHR